MTPQQYGMILIAILPMLLMIGGMKSDTLSQNAKKLYAAGNYTQARRDATSALALAPMSGLSGGGNATHDGNVVLGRLALRSGNIASAKTHLLAAGLSSGSPTLDSFGPNMTLAKELLAHNEQATVLRYFDECGSFWHGSGSVSLHQWTEEVRAGKMPDFGANLVY